jgi:hypothetical protein
MKTSSSGLLDECLVPEVPSSLKIEDLKPEEMFALNSLPKVELLREKHGKFSLNDLCVELSQVIDKDTVRKVELSCLEKKIAEEWKLSHEFKLVTTRNKEIDLVLAELEELAWRISGQFTDRDVQGIKEMLEIGRGEDHFDQSFVKQDFESLDHFLNLTNSYDDRIELLENWMARKETEISTRVNLPTHELRKPDHLISPGYL